MATIYAKSVTDNQLILAAREGFLRKFDFGDDWTVAAIGLYGSIVGTSGDNTIDTNDETVAVSTVADRLTIGIKDDSAIVPGLAGSVFLGVTTPDSADTFFDYDQGGGYSEIRGSAAAALAAVGFSGTTKVINSATANSRIQFQQGKPDDTTDYNFHYAVKFTIANRGLSSQTVQIDATLVTTSSQTPSVTSTYGVSSLLTDMTSLTYTAMGSALAWNNGAAAYTIPDCFWVRLPFYSHRLRLSAIRAVRLA